MKLLLYVLCLCGCAVLAYRPEDLLTYVAHPLGDFPAEEVDVFTYPPGLESVVRLAGRMGRRLTLGRCPEDHHGCYDLNNDRILGCCHVNQTCAMQLSETIGTSAHFLGCVDDPLQLCYDKMCPTGYSCCRANFTVKNERQTAPLSYCVPFDTTGWTFDPAVYQQYPPDVEAAGSDYDAFCGVGVDVYVSGVSFGVARSQFLPWTMYNTTAAQFSSYECNGVFGSYCAAGDACGTIDYLVANNYTDGTGIVGSIETFCCPADQTLCMWDMDPPNEWDPGVPDYVVAGQLPPLRMLGCAVDDRQETCCGSSICGGESKCCAAYVGAQVYDNVTDTTYAYNTTATTFCCPSASHCCYGLPMTEDGAQWLNQGPYGSQGFIADDASLPAGSYGYCGYTYAGNPCGLDIMVPQGRMLEPSFFPTNPS